MANKIISHSIAHSDYPICQLRCGLPQYIIDKNVTEETNVCSPSHKIVCNEHRKDIARIDNHWTMNLYSLQNLGCFQIPRIQRKDRDIVAHLNVFMGNVLCV